MRRLREAQRKTEEEKKRIAEQVVPLPRLKVPVISFVPLSNQISADRRETSKREAKPSVR